MTPFEYYKLRNVRTLYFRKLRELKERLTFCVDFYVTFHSATNKHLTVRGMINRVYILRDQLDHFNHDFEDCFFTTKSVYDEFGRTFKELEAEIRNNMSCLLDE